MLTIAQKFVVNCTNKLRLLIYLLKHFLINWHIIFNWNTSNLNAKNRIKLVIIGFIFVFTAITIRLFLVATSDYKKYRKLNNENNHRLDIIDRNENLLAVNLPTASLFANPGKIADPESAIKKLLVAIPELDYQGLMKKIANTDKNFIWIKRDITPDEQEKIYNLGLPGFGFEREQKRVYIYGNLLAHVVGYVGRDNNGLAGVEKYFDKFLTGQPEQEDRSSFGKSLQLSIDARVQAILGEEIEKVMQKFNAKGAAGIIVDPNNGEIIALVSKPDFDPHYPGDASEAQLFNMATQGVYEMGSGMKTLTMAMGFDTEVITMRDVYDLSYMRVNGFQLKDYHPMKGWHSVPHIFLKSSNIGVAQIMLEIGKSNLLKYLRELGMLNPVEIELPERARPLFSPASKWNDLSLVTMSYGYGISQSPLHFMQAMLPVVNGGISYPLTVIKRNQQNMPAGRRIFKESTSKNIRKLMRLVVSDGTGSKAEVNGYYIGGKTGTANIAYAGKYDKNRRISSFLGIMPASNPQFMIYILYNEPKGNKESYGFAGGGWTAAPTVGAVFKKIAALYGLEKPDENSKEVKEITNVQYKLHNDT